MKIVGLTGGIASGKSTVSAYLRSEGFAIVDLDLLAREALMPGTRGHRQCVLACLRPASMAASGGSNVDGRNES